jgi:hypothetical protein
MLASVSSSIAVVDEAAPEATIVAVDSARTSSSSEGSSAGVGEGVTSVDGVTSTSSASRHHFLRRV